MPFLFTLLYKSGKEVKIEKKKKKSNFTQSNTFQKARARIFSYPSKKNTKQD